MTISYTMTPDKWRLKERKTLINKLNGRVRTILVMLLDNIYRQIPPPPNKKIHKIKIRLSLSSSRSWMIRNRNRKCQHRKYNSNLRIPKQDKSVNSRLMWRQSSSNRRARRRRSWKKFTSKESSKTPWLENSLLWMTQTTFIKSL